MQYPVCVISRAHLAVILALGLLPSTLAAQPPCSLVTAASEVRLKQAALLKATVEEMSTEVPVAVRSQLESFKAALATAIDSSMSCASPTTDATAMQHSLSALLNANQPQKPFVASSNKDNKFDTGTYGADLKVAIAVPRDAPTLRAIEVSFGIECGSDTMLLIYGPSAHGWKRILQWESGEYSEISGAFGDFFVYTVLPADTGAIRVVAAHGKPWCTSRFSGFNIDVLAPTNDPDHPRDVWQTARSYSRGDFPTRLRSTADGFELRLNAPASDSSAYERNVVCRYRVASDQVTRIEPIAANARGFVEEWLASPWNEAAAQTAPEAIAGMKPIHERIANSDKDAKSYVSLTYGPVRSCLMKGQFEVEMIADPGGPQFYVVKQVPDGYSMVNFGTTQDDRCSGPDLMQKP